MVTVSRVQSSGRVPWIPCVPLLGGTPNGDAGTAVITQFSPAGWVVMDIAVSSHSVAERCRCFIANPFPMAERFGKFGVGQRACFRTQCARSCIPAAIRRSADGQAGAAGVPWARGYVMTAPVTVRERDLRALAAIVSKDRHDLPDGQEGLPLSLLADLKDQIRCDDLSLTRGNGGRHGYSILQSIPAL